MAVRLDSASKRAAARLGSVIKDKWTLDRLIGVGGMAAVYAATHRNKKRAAIKMLHPELSLDTVMKERFLREGYVANSVGHRGAVEVDDDDTTEDDCAYIVMELLDGETIDTRWERKDHRLPPQEVLSIVDQLLDTLTAAHAKGIIHRDIKPENLFLTREGVVKVLDFGIARLHELSGQVSSTQTGNTMGTPAYMAPEQARGKWEQVDERTDLWAVGATMFTLLTGEYVHEGDTVNETLALAVTKRARSIKDLRPDLHPALIEFVDRALIYEKAGRWPDAVAMQDALRRVYLEIQGEDVSKAPQLLVPELSKLPTIIISGDEDDKTPSRSPALTTARGVTASGTPTVRRSVLIRRQMKIGGAVGAAVLVVVLLLWLGSGDESPSAAATIPSADAAASALAAQSAQPPPSAEAEPAAVKLEELPKEKRRTGPATKSVRPAPQPTATKRTQPQDPFARRR